MIVCTIPMLKKINFEISESRNYNKVTIGVLDEPIDYETEDEFKAKLRKIAAILREEINLQFNEINKK